MPLFLDGGKGDIVLDPAVLSELADIQIGGFAAGGLGDVNGAIDINGDGDRIPDEWLLDNE